jgi:4-amino-4-deoxy-L-arabinose transferase-like glycosyltransferase
MAKKRRKRKKKKLPQIAPTSPAVIEPHPEPRPQETVPPRATPSIAPSYLPKTEDLTVLVLLLLAYLFTRLVNVVSFPLHYDEASYIHWGKVIAGDWSQRFLAAGWGGKQPLHTWLIALFTMLFSNTIFAGRAVSVLAGGISTLLIWLIARRLFSRRVAYVAAFLYIIAPYHLLYDRIALIDSLLVVEGLAVFWFSIRLLDNPTPWDAAGLALSSTAALLTKSSGLLFLVLIPVVVILYFDQKEVLIERVKRCAGPLLAVGVTACLIYFFVFGSTEGAQLVAQFEANRKYTLGFDEIMAMPWDVWGKNALKSFQVLWHYLTSPLGLLAFCALLVSPWLGKETMLLGLWGVLPILGFITVSRIFFWRYLLFATPFLLMAEARLLERVYEFAVARFLLAQRLRSPGRSTLVRAIGLASLALICLFALWQDYLLLFDPADEALTAIERVQYIDNSFYGLLGMSEYLKEQAQKEEIYVCVNRTYGPVQNGIFLYLENEPSVQLLVVTPYEGRLVAYDPSTKQIYPKDLLQQRPTFLAGYTEEREAGDFLGGHINLVKRFPSLTGKSYIALYQVRVDTALQ